MFLKGEKNDRNNEGILTKTKLDKCFSNYFGSNHKHTILGPGYPQVINSFHMFSFFLFKYISLIFNLISNKFWYFISWSKKMRDTISCELLKSASKEKQTFDKAMIMLCYEGIYLLSKHTDYHDIFLDNTNGRNLVIFFKWISLQKLKRKKTICGSSDVFQDSGLF